MFGRLRKSHKKRMIVIWSLLALVYTVALIVYLTNKHEDAGQFGDVFGFANAVASGIALILIAQTFGQGQEALALQKQEMDEQRRHLAKQDFENRFFRLLTSFENLVANTELTIGQQQLRGRRVYMELLRRLYGRLRGTDDDKGAVAVGYESLYASYPSVLGHYFRMLYHLVRIIHDSDLEPVEKQVYVRLLRAHLSFPELSLVFYNGISRNGIDKFYPLIEQYDLLQNLEPNYLALESHIRFYPNWRSGEKSGDVATFASQAELEARDKEDA